MKIFPPSLLAVAFVLSACASGLKLGTTPPEPTRTADGARGTVVLFLVDGLAVQTLQSALSAGHAPNLRRFFLGSRNSFPLGQAGFPTLTYPNITSILTTEAVGEHPILGNLVLEASGKIVAYDDAKNFPLLRSRTDQRTVFESLSREGLETASFSYVFGQNASDHMRVGIREGLEYEEHRYQSLDGRLLDALARFLRERENPDRWPRFLYVHLVGVDAVSHRYGPDSPRTQAYVRWLDQRMGEALAILRNGEGRARGPIVTLLTADHGFQPTTRYAPLAKLVRRADLGTVILNEGRFLSLYQPEGRPAGALAPVLEEARRKPGVAFTALRRGNVLELARGRRRLRFVLGESVCEEGLPTLAPLPLGALAVAAGSFRCPAAFDDAHGDYPFLVAELARYFTAPHHPDALLLAEPTTSFSKGMLGSHGGPTAKEVLVPVLHRNATIVGAGAVPTKDLLKLLRIEPRPAGRPGEFAAAPAR